MSMSFAAVDQLVTEVSIGRIIAAVAVGVVAFIYQI